MLVLTRKLDETIVIDGGRIVVTVVGLERGQVRLGINAPREISVHRGEVQDRIDWQSGMGDGGAATDE